MNKVQTAINAQLEQVIERQKHLGENDRTKQNEKYLGYDDIFRGCESQT